MASLASHAEPFTAVIHPDAFLEPGHMPQRIAEYCRKTGQAEPQDPGTVSRVILESLALRYRQVLASVEAITGRSIRTIHVVGGGSRNQLLNQFVAGATGRVVLAGPAEATAAGNLLVQAMGAGELVGLDGARAVVRASFDLTRFEPSPFSLWDSAYERFCALARP